jgi:hypothetical protein
MQVYKSSPPKQGVGEKRDLITEEVKITAQQANQPLALINTPTDRIQKDPTNLTEHTLSSTSSSVPDQSSSRYKDTLFSN